MAYGIVNTGPGKSLEAYTQEELEEILDEFATDDEVDALLKGHVTSEALDGALEDYVTSESLNGTLEGYVTSEALSSTLEDYATEEYVTGTLESYVTSDGLSSALESYVTSTALSETLENYVVSSVYEEASESLSGSLSTLQSSFSTLENTVEGISAEVGSLSAEISSVYVNLIDYEDLTDGTQVDEAGLSSSTVRTISSYIPVTAGETYTLLANADTDTIYAAVGWFDSSRAFLSAEIRESTAWTEDQEEELAAPEDAAYAVVCWTTEFTGYLEFWGYTTVKTVINTCLANLNVTAYGLSSRVAAVEEAAVTEDDLTTAVSSEVSSQVEQLADSITAEVAENISEITGQYVNLIDYDEVETGYHISSDGEAEEQEGWSASGYTSVEAGETYTVIMNTEIEENVLAYWYDADQGFLSRIWVSIGTKTAGYETDVEAPDDAAWVRLSWGVENADALGLWCWTTDADLIESHESSVSITAYGISSRVEAIEEDYATSSEITQLADSITLSVSNSTDTAKITLKAGDDNTQTATISMSGLVTFSDLETEGETTINGANIKTGTLSASQITSGTMDAEDVEITNLSADSITGGKLQAGSISLYDSFAVYSSEDAETSLGTLGAMKGQAYSDTGELEDTYGIAIADGTGKSYIIVTGRGARFTCGDEENSYGFYITDTGHFEVTCEGFYVNNEKISFD